MHFKNNLFSLLLLTTFMGFSQLNLSSKIIVKPSEPYQVVDGYLKKYFSNEKTLTSVKAFDNLIIIQNYDIQSNKEISKKTHEVFTKGSKLEEIIKLKDRIFCLYHIYNGSDKTFTFYSREINPTTLTINNEIKLFTTSRKVIGWEFLPSFDESKLLIKYRCKPLKKNDKLNYDELGLQVFNDKMTKVWGDEVTMPYTEKEINNLAYGVDNSGNSYMLVYLNESKKYKIFLVNNGKVVSKDLNINNELMFQEFKLNELPNGRILCSGFYANGLEYKYDPYTGMTPTINVNGIYTFEFDKEGKVYNPNEVEFPIETIKEYESARNQRKAEKREEVGKAGIQDLKLLHVQIQDDGTRVFVGEQFFIEKVVYWVNGKMKVKYIPHFEDVVVIKTDVNNKLKWIKKIPKWQEGIVGTSIKYINTNDSHYIVFLDDHDNANITINEAPKKHIGGRTGNLTSYQINDKTGSVEKHNLLDMRDFGGYKLKQFDVSRIFKGNENTFFLESYIGGKKDIMIKTVIN